jgi:hypothetical protein
MSSAAGKSAVDLNNFKFYRQNDVLGNFLWELASMATDKERMRQYVVGRVVAQIPKAFLEDFYQRAERAYLDEYAEMAHKTARIRSQRRFNLFDERFYRIDHELFEAANDFGLSVTADPLPENTWRHVYVSCGEFGFTQSYVRRPGDLPQPARFREKLASAGNMPRMPLTEPEDIYELKDFYAIFTHSPIGDEFSEERQRLGMLMFSVPFADMKGWAVNISVPELVAEYPAAKRVDNKSRGPTWKRREKEVGEE